MKKSFLIPTVLAIGSTAVLPVVSCKDTKEEIQTIKISGDQEVIKGKSATYSAEVTASSEKMDKTVTWSIILDENKTGSTINATTGEFTAGNIAGKVTIRATSVVDETKHDEFDINVVSAIKSITIGDIGDLEWDSEFTCKATVESPSGYDQTVTWEIEGKNTVSTIDPETGKITTGEKTESFVVKATSLFDSTVYATKRVKVVSPVKSIIISGDEKPYFGDMFTYTAEIEVTAPWSDVIEWYIDKDESGTGSKIDQETGAFEAGTKAGKVVIKAVPVADPLEFVTYEVIIQSPIDWVKVDNVADIEWNGQYTCHAVCYRVRGYSGEVTWSIDEPNASTTIDKTTGEITAGEKIETITVRATSVLDPTKSGTTTVKIVSPIKGITFEGQTQALPTGAKVDYSATVEVDEKWSKDVSWTIIEGHWTGSTITETGSFTAGTQEGKVVLKATSLLDGVTFGTLDVYIQDACPVSSIQLTSENAIAFKQSTIVKTEATSSVEGIYVASEVVSCNPGSTGSTWDDKTKTLTAGQVVGDVSLECKPIGYDVEPTTITISVAQNVFKYSTSDSDATITGIADSKYTRVAVLPTIADASGNTYNVVAIGNRAFQKNVTMVNLENATNLKKILQDGFNQTYITDITIPNSVEEIGQGAFYGSSIININIQKDSQWSTAGIFAFDNCYKLKKINLENATSLTSLSESMFINCTSLETITIPTSATLINAGCLSGCSSLNTINYLGTISEWKLINKSERWWHDQVKTNVVHCSDGDCGLDEK